MEKIVTVTQGQLAHAFELWASRCRENPFAYLTSPFSSGQEYGQAAAATLVELLGAGQPSVRLEVAGVIWNEEAVVDALVRAAPPQAGGTT